MTEDIRDKLTGYKTTGHNWNGITELNTPLPKAVILFFAASFIYAVLGWVFLPAWPLGTTFTKGLWGSDQQNEADRGFARIQAARASWEDQIATKDFAAIRADMGLMAKINVTAPELFGQNCQVCHGVNGQGGPGFPRLAGDNRVWGMSDNDTAETIRIGINSSHADTRIAQMPAFGRDGILQRPDIDRLVNYVQALSTDKPVTAAVKKLFVDNCAGCHGEDAKGVEGTGAPNLTDAYWLYGGDAQSITTTLFAGRHGQMPTWEGRLNKAQIRMLAIYVNELAAKAAGKASEKAP